jgi:hypothetical protein
MSEPVGRRRSQFIAAYIFCCVINHSPFLFQFLLFEKNILLINAYFSKIGVNKCGSRVDAFATSVICFSECINYKFIFVKWFRVLTNSFLKDGFATL